MSNRRTGPERQRAMLEFIRDYKRFFSDVERTTTPPSGAGPARSRDVLPDEGKRFEKLLLSIRSR